MPLVLFVLFLFLYLYFFVYKLAQSERRTIPFLFHYMFHNKKAHGTSIREKLEYIFLFLTIPFREEYFLSLFSEGFIYGLYLFAYFPDQIEHLNSKLFWEQTFEEYGISHTTTSISCIGGEHTHHARVLEKSEYIVKPIFGMRGSGISKVNGNELEKKQCNQKEFWIAQPQLIDCRSDTVRHFRAVTLYDGSIFSLWELKAQRGKVASNGAQGATVTYCGNAYCRHLSSEESAELEEMCERMKHLHADKFDHIFSLGWDLMFHCGEQGVKAYAIEGNICNASWFYPEKTIKTDAISFSNKWMEFMDSLIRRHRTTRPERACRHPRPGAT